MILGAIGTCIEWAECAGGPEVKIKRGVGQEPQWAGKAAVGGWAAINGLIADGAQIGHGESSAGAALDVVIVQKTFSAAKHEGVLTEESNSLGGVNFVPEIISIVV